MSETTAEYQVKNGYEYKDEELNPLRAENLISELFSGKKKILRKEIINTVYDTHVENGGAQGDKQRSSIRTGLDNMVDKGTADRLRRGYYDIHGQPPAEQPEPIDKDEANTLRSAVESEVEFICDLINQLEQRRSELSAKVDEL